MDEVVLRVSDFRKRYGDTIAVDGINFAVHRGEIFGLLGPNGAGKTTTLECLEGLRRADEGRLEILGVDPGRQPGKLRDLVGVQLQTSALPASMTPVEAMRFFCAYHRKPLRMDLVERLGLGEKQHAQYGSLSVGQQRRLSLALAIAHRPPVVFLDEPTAGLDVNARSELHALVGELKAEGTTILLATHDMAEAEKLAGRVAILLRGKIAATGAPLELTASGSGLTKISARTQSSSLQKNGFTLPAVVRKQLDGEYVVYFTTETLATVTAVLDAINKTHDKLIDLRVERPSLEERFLEITQSDHGGRS